MHPLCFASVVFVECWFVMRDQNEMEAPNLWHRKPGWLGQYVSIIVIDNETSFILFPALNKFVSIFNHIFPLMSINVHAIRLSLISPTQSVEPSPCRPFRNGSRLRSEPFLYRWGCHIIHNISGPYVTIFCDLCQMQLNIVCKISIFEDWRPISTISM